MRTFKFPGRDLQVFYRADWGAEAPRRKTALRTPVSQVDIHTTVTYNHPVGTPWQEVGRSWKGIQNYHRNTLGWNDIGYNFGVDRAGRIFVGRGPRLQGAATEYRNHLIISIVTIGNTDAIKPTRKQRKSIVKLIRRLQTQGVLTQYIKVAGHRKYSTKGKTCPGVQFTDKMIYKIQLKVNRNPGKPRS